MSPNQITAQVESCRTQPVMDCFIRLQRTFVSLAPITTKAQYRKALAITTALAGFPPSMINDNDGLQRV